MLTLIPKFFLVTLLCHCPKKHRDGCFTVSSLKSGLGCREQKHLPAHHFPIHGLVPKLLPPAVVFLFIRWHWPSSSLPEWPLTGHLSCSRPSTRLLNRLLHFSPTIIQQGQCRSPILQMGESEAQRNWGTQRCSNLMNSEQCNQDPNPGPSDSNHASHGEKGCSRPCCCGCVPTPPHWWLLGLLCQSQTVGVQLENTAREKVLKTHQGWLLPKHEPTQEVVGKIVMETIIASMVLLSQSNDLQ